MISSLLRSWRKVFPKLKLTAIGELIDPGTPAAGLPHGFDHFSRGGKPHGQAN
jgi:hypothetical protein